jgi:hypothetical protein
VMPRVPLDEGVGASQREWQQDEPARHRFGAEQDIGRVVTALGRPFFSASACS